MMRPLSLRIVVLAAIAGVGAASAPAATSRGARVTQVQKDVFSAGKALQNGAALTADAPVLTGANSRAELTFMDGTTVRIGQGSTFSFAGRNLSLSRGSALFKLGGSKAKIATTSLQCAASAGVISVHSAAKYEACFVISGAAVVNGVGLQTGEGYVRENGQVRKIAFDVKRMLETSFLVTKFPRSPWVAEAFATAAIQNELLAANRAQSALLTGRAAKAAGTAGSTTTSGRAATLVASANRGSSGSAVAGASAGTLSAGLTKTGAGSVSLTGGNQFTSSTGVSGGTLVVGSSAGTLILNPGAVIISGAGTSPAGAVNTGGALNTVGGTVNVNSGTLPANGTTNLITSQTLDGLTKVGTGAVIIINGSTLVTPPAPQP